MPYGGLREDGECRAFGLFIRALLGRGRVSLARALFREVTWAELLHGGGTLDGAFRLVVYHPPTLTDGHTRRVLFLSLL